MPSWPPGEIEVDARELKLLSASDPLPFQVNDDHQLASEDLRLKYRYLDLRRPELAAMLALRHKAAMAARGYLSSQSFLEIETPLLVKPTPEGARDYVVPSRVHHGSFYALPQSPQLYKQTLMISGCDRYFQLARCLRDEDLRADRQPEHTQIDIEMSFVTEDDVFRVVEGPVRGDLAGDAGREAPTPFLRITYDEAMKTYGSDKPTCASARVHRRDRAVRAIPAQRRGERSQGRGRHRRGDAAARGRRDQRHAARKFEDVVKAAGAGGLTFFKVLPADREKQQVIFPGALLDRFLERVGAQTGDAVVFTNGPWERTCKALGVLRTQLGQAELEKKGLLGKTGAAQDWRFVWVRQFPLFEYNEDAKRWEPKHHMFTMPEPEHLDYLETDPGKVYAQLYDVVLNGNELGSGSIRIHRPDIQERVMKVIGLTQEQAYEKFGFLLDAYRFAVAAARRHRHRARTASSCCSGAATPSATSSRSPRPRVRRASWTEARARWRATPGASWGSSRQQLRHPKPDRPRADGRSAATSRRSHATQVRQHHGPGPGGGAPLLHRRARLPEDGRHPDGRVPLAHRDVAGWPARGGVGARAPWPSRPSRVYQKALFEAGIPATALITPDIAEGNSAPGSLAA
jgi:aspartyl-tRNA synthetase